MRRNVIEYLKDSVDRCPNKVAFEDENRKVTFLELDIEAKKVAAQILERCGRVKNQPIAVYMDKSVECIISFLGIAYSGNFYSPLDLKTPMSRTEKIINVLRPIAIIYKDKELKDLSFDGERISFSELKEKDFSESEIEERYQSVLDIDPLYVLFTSGSTGQPKGVTISHKAVIDYTDWLYNKFHFNENTVFGNQAPFYFDNSILDIYSTLKNGATMNIIPERLFPFPGKLLDYLNVNKINTLFWVPSALIGVANSGKLSENRLQYIEKILFCGEVMPNKQLNIWRKEYPNVLYANLYGPTEITDVCTYYIVDRDFADDEDLPIGFSCENTEILVLNAANQLVEKGEIGELCVRGTCLSMGYYGDPDKTEQVFVQNPLHNKYHDLIYRTGDLVKYNDRGEIIYVCRKDYQIKHQGYRIELGEIETICGTLEGMERVCAVYDDKNKRIALFCTLSNQYKEVTEKMIYQQLKQRLPSYMLPAVIRLITPMPMNANGKIDRVKLKQEVQEKKEI